MTIPKLYYFPIRGRGEIPKLVLAVAKVEFEFIAADVTEVKHNRNDYPFAQIPRYVDDDVDLVQSNTITRYLARKHGLYGANAVEGARIDMVLDGVMDIRGKYLALIYAAELEEKAKAAFWSLHLDPAGMTASNGGAHLGYINHLLKKSGGKHFVGSNITAADLAAYDITDLLQRVYGADKIAALYPELAEQYKTLSQEPALKAYLQGPQRLQQANGNGLGN